MTSVMAAHFHSVPGRLRVHVPAVKGDVANARAVEASLSKLNGVCRVEGRELTGSVIIHYDPRATNSGVLLNAIGIRAESMASRVPAKIAGKVAEAVTWYLVEKAAERALPLLIAAIF